MSYKWPGIPNGDYSFDHGRAVWNRIISFLRRLCEKLDGDLVDATSDRRGLMTAADKAALDAVPDTYVRKDGDTVTGSIYNIYTNEYGQPVNHFWGRMAANDFWALRAGGEVRVDPQTGHQRGPDDSGYLEIATADNGIEPIYVSQYLGAHTEDGELFQTRVRRATLLDENGVTRFPVRVVAPVFEGAATKLGTADVGSATQPIYLDDGVATPCMYQLHKTVPADAVFTDTIYTHPITSGNRHIPSGGSSGQILRWAADGTAAWGEDNNTVYTHPTTSGNKHIPSGGSNGQILRWSADGTAAWGADSNTTYGVATTSANGLMSANDKKAFDLINAYVTSTNGNYNNYPYHLIGQLGPLTGSYDTRGITLLIESRQQYGGFGILKVEARTNQVSTGALAQCHAEWLVRSQNLRSDIVQVGFRNTSGDSIFDIYIKHEGTWRTYTIKVLSQGLAGNMTQQWHLTNANEVNDTTASDKKTSTNVYTSIQNANASLYSNKPYTATLTPEDKGIVADANTVNGHTVNIDVPSNAKFTDTTYTVFVPSGANAKEGLVPKPPTNAGTTKYLCENGTWDTPNKSITRTFTFDTTYIKTNNSAFHVVPGGTIISFCLETTAALSGTYTIYDIGTFTNPPAYGIRFLLVRQDNGQSIPALIRNNGTVRIEQKSIKGNNTWLWGGVFVPNS